MAANGRLRKLRDNIHAGLRNPRLVTQYLRRRLHRTRGPQLTTGQFGLRYVIDPQSALDATVASRGIVDDWIATHAKDLIPADAIVVDVGANVGLISLVFARQAVPRGLVYAYEPDRQSFLHLQANVELNNLQNILTFPVALQNDPEAKALQFNVRRAIDGDGNENRGLSSLVDIPLHTVDRIAVQASTLDREAKRLQLRRLDLLKIDVEGAEYRVLLGGRDTISKFRPVIHYEYSTVLDTLTGSAHTTQCFEFLRALGYSQHYLRDERVLVSMRQPAPELGNVNILALPPGYTWHDPSSRPEVV